MTPIADFEELERLEKEANGCCCTKKKWNQVFDGIINALKRLQETGAQYIPRNVNAADLPHQSDEHKDAAIPETELDDIHETKEELVTQRDVSDVDEHEEPCYSSDKKDSDATQSKQDTSRTFNPFESSSHEIDYEELDRQTKQPRKEPKNEDDEHKGCWC